MIQSLDEYNNQYYTESAIVTRTIELDLFDYTGFAILGCAPKCLFSRDVVSVTGSVTRALL